MTTSTVPPVPTEIQPDPKQAWLETRRKFVGGSDAYQLLNEKQYGRGCSRALAYDKLGAEPDFEEDDPELQLLFKRGNVLEPVIASLYAEETGRHVINPPKDLNGYPVARMSKQYPFAGVHVDRTILAGYGGVEETGDLEIKSRAEGPYWRMVRNGPFTGDFLQTQWSNFVTGHKWSAFVALGVFGSIPMRHYDFARDEKIIEIFKREGEQFANTVWGKGELPAHPFPATDDRCKVCVYRKTCRGELADANSMKFLAEQKRAKGDLIQIDNPELAQALQDRDLVKQEIKALTSDKEDAPGALEVVEKRIYDLQRDENGNRIERGYILGYGKSYLTQTVWSGLDATRLKAEDPALYEKYFVKRATGSETLRTYPATK